MKKSILIRIELDEYLFKKYLKNKKRLKFIKKIKVKELFNVYCKFEFVCILQF